MKEGFVAKYWEDRYKKGGNSGLGSYDPIAIKFKADYINNLIKDNNVKTLVEFGCGDGNQLKLFKGYTHYYGTDISKTVVEKCKKLFSTDDNKTFEFELSKINSMKYDLSISLDVIYHLVEDSILSSYLHDLFNSSDLVSIYTTNHNAKYNGGHVRHREIKTIISELYPNFMMIDEEKFSKYNVMFLTYKKK